MINASTINLLKTCCLLHDKHHNDHYTWKYYELSYQIFEFLARVVFLSLLKNGRMKKLLKSLVSHL